MTHQKLIAKARAHMKPFDRRKSAPPLNPRPVKLVVTGPEGQRFSGSYVADGITSSTQGIAPATFSFQARNVAYDFKRDRGDGEFRVALFIGELCRLSTTSDKRQGVRGELHHSGARENYWAAGY
jgi:hypothetical protein